jgi:hypothetical protein
MKLWYSLTPEQLKGYRIKAQHLNMAGRERLEDEKMDQEALKFMVCKGDASELPAPQPIDDSTAQSQIPSDLNVK